MPTRARQLMEFIESIEISTVYKGNFEWQKEAETKINDWLEKLIAKERVSALDAAAALELAAMKRLD